MHNVCRLKVSGEVSLPHAVLRNIARFGDIFVRHMIRERILAGSPVKRSAVGIVGDGVIISFFQDILCRFLRYFLFFSLYGNFFFIRFFIIFIFICSVRRDIFSFRIRFLFFFFFPFFEPETVCIPGICQIARKYSRSSDPVFIF